MAFFGQPITLGATDTTVYTCPPTIEASLHGLVVGNTTAGAVTFTIKFYDASEVTTTTIASGVNVGANSAYTWPKPIDMNPGDIVKMSASSGSSLVALVSAYTAQAYPVSVGFVPRGDWTSVIPYVINDVVALNGRSYLCMAPNTNKDPETEFAYWQLLADKGPPGEVTLAGAQTLLNKTYTAPKYTRDDDGNIGGGTWAIDYANGPVIKATATAGITSITMSNWPASGTAGHLRLMLSAGAYSITFPAWKWIKSDLTTTTTFADLGLTLPSANACIIDLFSDDGGTTMYATVGRN